MAKYSLTDPAFLDLQEIVDYIDEDNPEAASALLERFFASFDMLAGMTKAGRRREDLVVGLRSFPQGSYLIFYRSVTEGIEIIRVLHSARDIETIFEQ